jgi:SAM-dependent methyltransferase
VRIEVGAGATAHDGFIAVDLNPEHADVVADAQNLPFDDGSVTALRAVDVLEHVSYRDTDKTLAEWARVCAPAAVVYIQVPDAATVMQWYVTGDQRLRKYDKGACPPIIGATWRLFGGHADDHYVGDDGDWRWNAHYAAFDADYLTAALDRAGFAVDHIETNGHPNLLVDAHRR